MTKSDSEQLRSELEDAIKRIKELECQTQELFASFNRRTKRIIELRKELSDIRACLPDITNRSVLGVDKSS